ncbi:transposase [Bacillus cereus]|uniref:Transposase n=1 Tax=Bacillus cereus TaxID=1396 RepID=A0A2A9A2K3_BACCE|nr:transposase [Bacillus cereus]PFE14928.1 transposase [Bacillus cereus]
MFTTIFIALFCYIFFVVRKVRKNMLIEEAKKKERENAPVERPVYWCPRECRPIGRERERATVPTKEITLEKDVASVYDLVATSVQKNLGEEASNKLEQEIEAVEEVEYVEDFHHTPASEAVYDIPFPIDEDIPFLSDMDTPEEFLGYEVTFRELEQLPIPHETEHVTPVQNLVSEEEEFQVVKWTAGVVEREQGLTRVMNMSNRKRYWIHTEGEILPENKLLYIELEVDSTYSYTLVGWSDRQLGSI